MDFSPLPELVNPYQKKKDKFNNFTGTTFGGVTFGSSISYINNFQGILSKI